MECSCSSRHQGVDASTTAAIPMTMSGPRPCSQAGLANPTTVDSARPASGMTNCRFCQKSKVIDRTLMKCGWLQ